MNEYVDANREAWNEWAQIHSRSSYYDVEGFKAGKCTLHSLELQELGDVTGKTLLHLQCHFGLDTLSWARRGAVVTGVDFSDQAIATARSMAGELQLDAQFVCSTIDGLRSALRSQYDVVYTSYGILTWLPDLDIWAEVISRFLKPGGVFYLVDFHPFAYVFDDEAEPDRMEIAYPYFRTRDPLRFEPGGTYAEPAARTSHPTYEWPHPMSEIINSLIDAGLRIEFLHEFDFNVDGTQCQGMIRGDDCYWRLPVHAQSVPLMFSIRCRKDGA